MDPGAERQRGESGGGRADGPLRSTGMYLKDLSRAARDPVLRSMLGIAGVLIAIGAAFYALVEHWSVLDAFYFSVVTLATVGFGDFAPRTPAGKLFTVAYIVVGVSTLAAILGAVVRAAAPHVLDRAGVHGIGEQPAERTASGQEPEP